MRKPRLSKKTIEKLFHGETVNSGKYEYCVRTQWNDDLNAFADILTRWDEDNNYEEWEIPAEGIYAFEK